jgi:hypothetical protein
MGALRRRSDGPRRGMDRMEQREFAAVRPRGLSIARRATIARGGHAYETRQQR